eukprot:NODE_266_length_12318_cov_0.301498.p6 type:complete len:129 gc:universal NODE_266_length_12318_cov_0.301498:12170-11784(-)
MMLQINESLLILSQFKKMVDDCVVDSRTKTETIQSLDKIENVIRSLFDQNQSNPINRNAHQVTYNSMINSLVNLMSQAGQLVSNILPSDKDRIIQALDMLNDNSSMHPNNTPPSGNTPDTPDYEGRIR